MILVVTACTGPVDTAPTDEVAAPSQSTAAATPPSPGPTDEASRLPGEATTPSPGAPRDPAPTTAGMLGAASPADPVAGQIVFTTAHGAVGVADPASDEVTTLDPTGRPSASVQPVAAGDGMVWTDAAAPDGGFATALHDGATSVRRVAHPVAPFMYLPSPDSTRIAALGNDPAGRGVALVMIESPDADDVTATTVDLGQPYFVSWSPDDRLAAHVGDQLAVVESDGTRRPIPATPGAFQAPAWTADGDLVVVLDRDVGTTVAATAQQPQASSGDLAVISDAGALVTTIAPVAGPVGFVVGGDRLAWVEGGTGSAAVVGPLRVADLATGAIQDVSTGPVATADWSPDGSMLLFLELDTSGQLVPRVWDGAEVVDFSSITPTARWATEYLPFWFQYAQGITQWAPDGTAFVQAATTPDGDGIWIQPLVEDRRQVAAGDMAVWLPS